MSDKGKKTREKIKEKAYMLFAQKGFKEVTMKDICDATGLSRGGLYHYFSSTADIFEAIWRDLTNATEEIFTKKIVEKESAVKILSQILDTYKSEIEEQEKSLTLAIYEYSHTVNNLLFTELNNAAKRKWRNLIIYGIENGEFRSVNVDAVVDLIIYSYQGARMWSTILLANQGISKHIVECVWDILVIKKEETSYEDANFGNKATGFKNNEECGFEGSFFELDE